jgi:hypothetical protein
MISPFQLCFFAICAGHNSFSGLRTIYRPRPFQRALICEDWPFGTGVLRGRKTANNIDDSIALRPLVKYIEGLIIKIGKF